jgi:hypothetical protein
MDGRPQDGAVLAGRHGRHRVARAVADAGGQRGQPSDGLPEAIEAMRWCDPFSPPAARPSDIAIATASPADYDDHFLALRADANIDLHFVHGVRTVTTREGQAAAALADIVVRGLSQSRLRRLAALCRQSPLFEALPEGWLRVLPADAPMSTPNAWDRLLARLKPEDWPDGMEHAPALRASVDLLAKGPDAAPESARPSSRPRTLWRKALLAGPAADRYHPRNPEAGRRPGICVVAWMPASARGITTSLRAVGRPQLVALAARIAESVLRTILSRRPSSIRFGEPR